MITAVLLLPVIAVLLWLYWYLLPGGRRWTWRDTLLLCVLTALSAVFNHLSLNAHYENAGPLWPVLVSTAGVYTIFATGLPLGLVWRRRSMGEKSS